MDDRLHNEAVAAARQLLQRFKAEHPEWENDKTPIDELVSWHGLEIATFHQDDRPEGTYGWLEPEEDLIWLCRGLPETLRRFTLAHELGHAVLHRHASQQAQHVPQLSREDPCQVIDVQEAVNGLIDQEQSEEVLGIGQSYDPRSQRELAANIFAAELLMPLERVQSLYLRPQTLSASLAGIFGVSATAMLNRLAGLLNGSIAIERATPGASGASPEQAHLSPAPKKQYDEFQQAAIEAATPALIVAGPGSGKTSTLIGRAEYLIRTMGIPAQHILALTFSRKAAQEMQERLGQMLADTPELLPTVSTFHAFCAELLRTHGALVGLRSDFTLVDDAEGYFLLRRLADELPLHHYQHLQFPTYYFPDLLQAISRAKDELVTPEQYAQLAQQMREQAQDDEERQKAEKALEVAAIYTCYQAALQRRGDTDFGGLIMLTVQLLQQHPEVLDEQQQRYQHILVDEFQDMNRASGVLLRLLAGAERRAWVVGDADQAIYRFRGASPANITTFKDDYPGANVLPLSCNYRSRPDIVHFADAFRQRQMAADTEESIRQTIRPTQPDAYVILATAADEASEYAGIAADMRYQQAQHGHSYRDMVVLCRTRAQARKVSHALAQAGLPVLERGGGSMLEQEHMRDVLSLVLLLARPGGMGMLRVARQREHALTQDDIETLLLAAREQQSTPEALIVRGEIPPTMSALGRRSLLRLADILHTLGRMPDVWSMLAQYLFIETPLICDVLNGADSVQNTHDTDQVLSDYAALLQLARRYDQRRQKEDELGLRDVSLNLQEQAKEFLDYLNVLLTLRQDSGQRQQDAGSNAEDGAIRVLTVHASKGLEFPVVYLPGLVQRRFPMQARSSPISAPKGMLPESETTHESGEACLFYVGATRARDRLVLSYSERYGKQQYKPSPYLDALLAGLPADRVTKLRWEAGIAAPGTPPLAPARGATTFHDTPLQSPLGMVPTRGGGAQPSEQFIEAMKPAMLSVAAIETYLICPRRYAYGTIYGFQREESAYLLFWQATQKTLEALQRSLVATDGASGPEEEKIDKQEVPHLTQQEAEDLYIQHWQAVGGHEYPFASVYEQHGREIVKSAWSMLTQGKHMQWDVRRSFTLELAGTPICVEVDRVEASAQGGKPVRFVRNRVGKSKEKPTAQVRELLYAQAYRQLYPGQRVELHHHNLSTGEMVSVTLTEKREQKLYDDLEQAIRGMEQHEYTATPDAFVCPTCPFYLICPA